MKNHKLVIPVGSIPKFMQTSKSMKGNIVMLRFCDKKKEKSTKAAMQNKMYGYLKDNDIGTKDGTDVVAIMCDICPSFSKVYWMKNWITSSVIPSMITETKIPATAKMPIRRRQCIPVMGISRRR